MVEVQSTELRKRWELPRGRSLFTAGTNVLVRVAFSITGILQQYLSNSRRCLTRDLLEGL